MRTIQELEDWIDGAIDEFGDPAEPVGQIFARWHDPIVEYKGGELVCGTLDGGTVLRIAPETFIPLPLETGTNGHITREGVCLYGVKPVIRGVWYLTPSLNLPGLIHAFVTMYNVPDPPPWDRRIIVVSECFRDRSALTLLRGGVR